MSDDEVMKLLQIAEPLPDIIRRAYAAGKEAGLDRAAEIAVRGRIANAHQGIALAVNMSMDNIAKAIREEIKKP